MGNVRRGGSDDAHYGGGDVGAGGTMLGGVSISGSSRGAGAGAVPAAAGGAARSFNDEERKLSNMLTLANMEDDGAPTPIKNLQAMAMEGYDDEDDFLHIRKVYLQDLLAERETLLREMQRYKDENTVLFRDLGSAEDCVEELQEKQVAMEEEMAAIKAGAR